MAAVRTVSCRGEDGSRGAVRLLQWSGQLMLVMAGEVEILEMYVRGERERGGGNVCVLVQRVSNVYRRKETSIMNSHIPVT